MMAITWSVVCCFAATGLGRLVVRPKEYSTGWAHAWCAGLLLWGFISLGMAESGLWNTETARGLVFLSLLGWLRTPRKWPEPNYLVLIAVAVLVPGLIDALGPIVGSDERYLHLGVPTQIFRHEEIMGGLLHPNANRPLTLQMTYGIAMAANTPSSAPIMHWMMSVGLLVLVAQCAQAHFKSWWPGITAAVLLAGSTSVQIASGMAGSDIPAAFAVLAALDAALRGQRGSLVVASGLAISIKYTTVGPLIAIFLFVPMSWKTRWILGIMAVLSVTPWWIRNFFEGIHPLFPFTGWPDPEMHFQYLDKYGVGRKWNDFLLLPWHIITKAETQSFRFLGQIHPLLILMMIPAPLAVGSQRLKPWIGVSVFGFVAWAAGPHLLRYLIPTLPVLALTGAYITLQICQKRLAKRLLFLSVLGGTTLGLRGTSQQAQINWALLNNPVPAKDDVFQFCNANLPKDAVVALLFEWSSTAVERKQILGSIEDHIPTRHFLLRNVGREAQALVEAGATHAVIREALFLPKTYSFLSAEELDQDFNVPVSNLNRSVQNNAILLHQTRTHRVYRLTPAP